MWKNRRKGLKTQNFSVLIPVLKQKQKCEKNVKNIALTEGPYHIDVGVWKFYSNFPLMELFRSRMISPKFGSSFKSFSTR